MNEEDVSFCEPRLLYNGMSVMYKTSGGLLMCVCFYVCAHVDGAVVLSDTFS